MTMGFRRSDLQEAFFVPGTHAFRIYGYGTSDALEEVLRPNYFAAAGALLRPGELIYVSVRPFDGGGVRRWSNAAAAARPAAAAGKTACCPPWL
jgi:hypothetical protein